MYAGRYQTERGWGIDVSFEDGILLLKQGGRESRLHPVDETTFQVDEKEPLTVTFEMEEDKPTGLTVVQPNRTMVFKKVQDEEETR